MFVSNQESINFNSHVLILPAISIGNVGQLASDLLLNKLYINNTPPKKVGFLNSRYILPMVGNQSLDSENESDLCVNLEVFQVPNQKITILQQHAPVIAGCVALYIEELLQWFKESKFEKIIVIGGADAGARVDSQILNRQPRFIGTSSVETSYLEKLTSSGALPMEQREVNPFTETTMKPGPHVINGGLTNKLYESCEEKAIPLVALLIFCKEGNNIPESFQMATCVNNLLQIIPQHSKWIPPKSWAVLLGGFADTYLYF